MTARMPSDVAHAYAKFPAKARRQLLRARTLIFAVARADTCIGPITEVLRWGQPSYLTETSRSGSTVRLGVISGRPTHCAMFVHCQTSLVKEFRQLRLNGVEFVGNRAIAFSVNSPLPVSSLKRCIALALQYRRHKRAHQA